jgi:hypothetical protein
MAVNYWGMTLNYRSILTLEKAGLKFVQQFTAVIYLGIFITLASGVEL